MKNQHGGVIIWLLNVMLICHWFHYWK